MRIDYGCRPGGAVADQIGGAAEVFVEDLAEKHWVPGYGNARALASRPVSFQSCKVAPRLGGGGTVIASRLERV